MCDLGGLGKTVTETDAVICYFICQTLRRQPLYEKLLDAAKPLAREIYDDVALGEQIRVRVGPLLSVPLRAMGPVPEVPTPKAGELPGLPPFHLTLETAALLVALGEQQELQKEIDSGEAARIKEATPKKVKLPEVEGLRVLVTGATGFLGGVIVRRLVAAGATVTASGRRVDEGGALAAAGAR